MSPKITPYLITLLLLLPTLAMADTTPLGGDSQNLGIAANSVNGIIAFVYDIIDVILYAGAAIMGMSGLLKYRLHRRNPQQVPLSTPVTELAIAGVLILLAVLAQLSTSHKTVKNSNLPNVTVSAPPVPAQRPTPQNAYPY